MFKDKFDVELTEMDNQISIASDNSDSDSTISELDLDEFEDYEDAEDFEFDFPKNSVCAAHTLQLVLKDVFDNCQELKNLNQVNFKLKSI